MPEGRGEPVFLRGRGGPILPEGRGGPVFPRGRGALGYLQVPRFLSLNDINEEGGKGEGKMVRTCVSASLLCSL